MAESQAILSFQEQLRHTGSTDQLYSVRRMTIEEGPGAGQRVIEVCTAAGLRAVFCESRALDLYELHFRGTNLGFMTKNGLLTGRVLPVEGEFTPSWPAGFLATCGLRNTGPSCTVDGEFHPLHGRIGGMSADQVCIDIEPEANTLVIKGQMRESALFGCNLLLRRMIKIALDGASIEWYDTVENQAAEAEALFVLYHFNFGYPFLSPALQLTFPPDQIIPRTDEAKKGLAEYDQICAPIDGYQEQVFFHKLLPSESQEATVRLFNPQLQIRASLTYNPDELPVLVQWKSMKSGDYALGIEPSNNYLHGRGEEIASGYDQILPGFGRRQFNLRLDLE